MLGHVTAESISIWARTSKPGQFQVQYGRMPDRLDQVSEAATTTADRDNTGWVRLNGLSPNTRYYYRPVTSSDAGPAGSFLTLPASESYRDASHESTRTLQFQVSVWLLRRSTAGGWHRTRIAGLWHDAQTAARIDSLFHHER